MPTLLTLQDLKGKSEADILEHLATQYSGTASGHDYGSITNETIAAANELLKNKEVLIAYESVGDYGCDSSSFFLLRCKATDKIYTVNGSHCSCFGFEGQLDLQETELAALKLQNENGGVFYPGGYDENEQENRQFISDYIKSL